MGAEGAPPVGETRSANHTMNQGSSGAVQGSGSLSGSSASSTTAAGSTSAMQSKSSAGAGGGGSGGGWNLTFPSNLGTDPTQMNMIMFTPKEISGGGADPRTITFRSLPGPVIALPIPDGLNTSYQQSWAAASVEGRNAMIADKGGELIKRVANSLAGGTGAVDPGLAAGLADKGKGARISNITKMLTEGASMSGAWDAAKQVSGALTSMDFWDETAGGVAAELGAMVAAGPAEGLATAAQYTTGMKAVKQTMMAYGGPGFRSFSYTFSLKPFSPAESEIVRRICEVFKEYSAPHQQSTRYTRVYDLPAVFKIQFFNGSQEHRHIAKIGHCALTNISISYGGGKFTTFSHPEHPPVQVDLTLNFQEMELLNRQMLKSELSGGIDWPLIAATDSYTNTTQATNNAVYAPKKAGIS